MSSMDKQNGREKEEKWRCCGEDRRYLKGRCHQCERRDKHRHLYSWRRGKGRLLWKAHCPVCKHALKSTSVQLEGSIVRHHEDPVFLHDDLSDILSVRMK